jgi:hypothetical protein
MEQQIEQTHTIYMMTLNGPFFITLTEGSVNNMGVIQIDIGNDGYSYRLVDYDVVQFDFQNEFPDSEWNVYEWINISVNIDEKGGNSLKKGVFLFF